MALASGAQREREQREGERAKKKLVGHSAKPTESTGLTIAKNNKKRKRNLRYDVKGEEMVGIHMHRALKTGRQRKV